MQQPVAKRNSTLTTNSEGRGKKLLTPRRIKRPKTATREIHEVATRRDTPTDSLAEYLATAIILPTLEISRKTPAPGREASKSIGEQLSFTRDCKES